ncbi:MAG TPA: glycosyltransferase [Chloroflexota bacterium]|nr:glycosyltransferase [Chloroflexota bacterium]
MAPFGLGRKGTTRARVLPLAAALVAAGHAVDVLVPAWDVPAERGRRYRWRGAQVTCLPLRRRRGAATHVQLALELLHHARATRAEVIHCFKPIGYSGALLLALRALGATGAPRALLALDLDDLEGGTGWAAADRLPAWQRALRTWQERAGVRAAPLVTVASRYLADLAARWRGGAGDIVYLPNAGEPPVSLAPGAALFPGGRGAGGEGEPPILLLYSRFNEFAPARGAALVAAILQRVPAARLLVVGPVDSAGGQAFLRELAVRGCAGRVLCTGFQEGAARDTLLAQDSVALWLFDDTAINRARSPAKLVELLWAGRAVVAEAVGEVPALAGGAACLVPPGAHEALVEATVGLLTTPALRHAYAARARARAGAHLDWPARARRLAAAYTAALEPRRRPC